MKRLKKLFLDLNSRNEADRREARSDLAAFCCFLYLVITAVVSIWLSSLPSQAGVKDSEVPGTAKLLTGTAKGRNGDFEVTVVADSAAIYQIRIGDHQETDGIGTKAVEQMPVRIYDAQSLKVDAVTGATITSDAIRTAVLDALKSGGIEPSVFGGARIKAEKTARRVQTNSGVTVTTARDWSEKYPDIYASWAANSENSETEDYLELYPMLRTLYEPYGFSKDYKSARGHQYTLKDVSSTERIGPNSKASCWTCKTPQFTNMVNEEGISVYGLPFRDIEEKLTESVSCYTCHANDPGRFTVTHTYLIEGVGDDFDRIDGATLSCGQCHNEYFFDPGNGGATTLPHDSLDAMSPEAILAFYNNGTNFPDGQPFADYTNPRTGVRQIKVQHPELETFLGEGSRHAADFTCADCHMGKAQSANGGSYPNHRLTSPLDNEALIASECSKCHADLAGEVRTVQKRTEERTVTVGYELEFLTESLAKAVEEGSLKEETLEQVRALARDAQFYWDFVFVENSEGAHNPALSEECLDKAAELANRALNMLRQG
ncbi:MAG: ammonia-forming cytochrome c nitrite reductase subunit c552 [Lachnospiraceae bacterium]|nr:ammonia-forming cytochrome c nitrite reductase subunit c552 [Lachnospiraceae bacterium]